jgi:hypothetical protein
VQQYFDFYTIAPERFMVGVQHDFGWLEVDGYQLATHIWHPEHPLGTVFIVHGYYDHTGLYGHLVRFWLEQGYAVMMHDLPGHGLSSGNVASIDCFSRYSTIFRHCGRFQVVYGLPIQIRSSITIPPEKTLMQGIAKTAHNKVSGAPASAFLIIVRFTTAHTM